MLELGTVPGDGGTALEREAADSQVTVLAAQAAAAMGNRELAAGFAGRAADPGTAAFIRAVAADPAQEPDALAAAWRTALAAAVTHEQVRHALYELSALGQLAGSDLEAAQQRESVSAEATVVLAARSDAANGQADAAIAVLRRLRDSYPPAAVPGRGP
jgi:hypothetical protein